MPQVSASTPPRDVDEDAGAPDQPLDEVALADLGLSLFEDRALSRTGTQSCASCHAKAQAFTGSNDHDQPRFPVSRGAADMTFGRRNAPTAMYAQFSPAFAFIADANDPSRYSPRGGLFWDGRVDTLSEQAALPFVDPREMALPDPQAVVERVRTAKYVAMFEPLFGGDALSDVAQAYRHITDAIAAFERTSRFAPFSSRFDGYLRGQVQLSEQEQLGFALFTNPLKANCVACHAGGTASREPQDWLFSNFGYASLGVPRNMQITDNADAGYFDLGLCQSAALMPKLPAALPAESVPAFVAALCGAFKVPTLRNVAKTAPYMHNGFFAELRDAVDFHVTRDTNAARWYPSAADGTVLEYNDLPEVYRANVIASPVPFDRKAGDAPGLTAEEIDAVVAFLLTLTDE